MDPRFVPAEQIEFRIGKASRMIEARHIAWLEIDPSRMEVSAGQILYGARLVLADGARFPDSSASDTLTGVFVGVDSRLVGNVGSSRIEIPLSQLRTMGTDEWFEEQQEKRSQNPVAQAVVPVPVAKKDSMIVTPGSKADTTKPKMDTTKTVPDTTKPK
jgi:hypothetical protein